MPALAEKCSEWELCMNTPIEVKVKTIKNVANLIAQSVDSFITQLSYISMAFMSLILVLFFKYGLPTMVTIVRNEMPQGANMQ